MRNSLRRPALAFGLAVLTVTPCLTLPAHATDAHPGYRYWWGSKVPDAPANTDSGNAASPSTPEPDAADDVTPALPEASQTLTIASWGGAYTKSQELAFFKPFHDATGISVKTVTHQGGIDALKDAGGSWDVADLAPDTVSAGCDDGLLQPIDADILTAPAQGSATNDFFPGAISKCGIASVAWSANVIYGRGALDDAPGSVADLFDTEKFKGKRALPRAAKYTLELALLGDGVAPDDVYTTLATDEGVTRAFDKLDTIKDRIVWWDTPAASVRLIEQGKAAMGLAFNGRVFKAVVGQNKPIGIVWAGEIYDLDVWAIPKGAPHADAARKFIAYATAPERLAQQARWFPYGPMRKSSLGFVGKHADIDVAMAQYLPTADNRLASGLKFDGAWWKDHGAALEARFSAWLGGDKASGGEAAKPKKSNAHSDDEDYDSGEDGAGN